MSLWKFDYIGVNSIFDSTINFGTDVVDRHSVVLASVCEISQPEGEPLDFPFKGLAVMTVHNIVPHDDGTVEITIDTGWQAGNSLINVRANFAVNP
jgi:hypothetical protein